MSVIEIEARYLFRVCRYGDWKCAALCGTHSCEYGDQRGHPAATVWLIWRSNICPPLHIHLYAWKFPEVVPIFCTSLEPLVIPLSSCPTQLIPLYHRRPVFQNGPDYHRSATEAHLGIAETTQRVLGRVAWGQGLSALTVFDSWRRQGVGCAAALRTYLIVGQLASSPEEEGTQLWGRSLLFLVDHNAEGFNILYN